MLRVPVAVFSAMLALHSPQWAQAPSWKAGVVQIKSKTNETGSGFVVARRGGSAYIVTAAHVVEGDPSPAVTFEADPGRRPPYKGEVLDLEGKDARGLALLVVDSAPARIQVLREGARPNVSGTVEVAGFPVDGGKFSGLRLSIKRIQGRDLFLTLEAEAGFSGGPVLLNGRVVGMVYGRGGSGVALGSACISEYLGGNGVEWGSSAGGPAVRKAGETYLNPTDGLTYVWIPAGKFRMGCSEGDKECSDGESPAHEVELSGFWMGETEVTQEAWRKVMKTEPSHFKGESLPVEQVSWEDASRYCQAVGGRLPTEAEWEYAARAGSVAARYGELKEVAWYGENAGNKTHPVRALKPNAWGLYDTLGNAWERVADWFGPYSAEGQRDPRGASSGSFRALRGGVRVSYRGWDQAADRIGIGFRCALEFP